MNREPRKTVSCYLKISQIENLQILADRECITVSAYISSVLAQHVVRNRGLIAGHQARTLASNVEPETGVYNLAHQRGAIRRMKAKLNARVPEVYTWLHEKVFALPLTENQRIRMNKLRGHSNLIQRRCESMPSIKANNDVEFFRELIYQLART